jgi:hypothetical protein
MNKKRYIHCDNILSFLLHPSYYYDYDSYFEFLKINLYKQIENFELKQDQNFQQD